MKKILVLLVLCFNFGLAQTSVNNYKYALVPSKFDFLKTADKYSLNTYTKMFMQKYGFQTFLDNESLPAEFASNNCNKVFVDVLDQSSLFVTKLAVELKDCQNKILFTSATGESREKDYKVAYTQALREAFASFDALHYKYTEIVPVKGVVHEVQSAIKEMPASSDKKYNIDILSNGFQVVDGSQPIMRCWKTEVPNTFISTKGNINGLLFKKQDTWYFQYYENEKLVTEVMDIRF
jgi:hypothetical protein